MPTGSDGHTASLPRGKCVLACRGRWVRRPALRRAAGRSHQHGMRRAARALDRRAESEAVWSAQK